MRTIDRRNNRRRTSGRGPRALARWLLALVVGLGGSGLGGDLQAEERDGVPGLLMPASSLGEPALVQNPELPPTPTTHPEVELFEPEPVVDFELEPEPPEPEPSFQVGPPLTPLNMPPLNINIKDNSKSDLGKLKIEPVTEWREMLDLLEKLLDDEGTS